MEEIAALGPQALAVPTDVRNPDQCKAMVEATVAHFGKLDILINNAGGAHGHVGLHRMDLAKWDRDIQLNLSAAQYCAQAAIPHLKRSKGTIVNVSSIAGKQVGAMTGPAYSAAKFGLNAMTESLNIEECVSGIRATAVCPGEVATPILDKRPIPVSAEDRAKMVQPDDCGELMLFLARLPAHVCINELTITPTWNRAYVAQARTIAD